MIKIKTSCRSH